MATILLSAAGAAIGGGIGGSILGLSGAVIGRAIGATVGRAIDQRLMGGGSRAVETGRIDRFRLTGASEGAPVGRIWGRMRLPGQVIWATRFVEHVTTTTTKASSGGGKGSKPKTRLTEYSYTVSLALALCEGEIARIGRIWADGNEISHDDLTLRVYRGGEGQLPDPKIEAVEGAGNAPAYRGIAYVVIEDIDLGAYGNRVPQFSFEVMRSAQGPGIDNAPDLAHGVRGVAMIPGTGEYSLATSPVYYLRGKGDAWAANVNSPAGTTDMQVSLHALDEELPACGSVSLVVSWFGSDLRCADCTVMPKVEDRRIDGTIPWRAGGIGRPAAVEVARIDGRPVYGGTPSDASVVEAIAALRARGKAVMFYPFVLMEQLADNGRADPWTGAANQPALPWRGRITLSSAPGRAGTPDRTSAAAAEVAAFFGNAQPGHFGRSGSDVSYSGPAEWSYRRFILHYAHLCAAAGGVESFCIGSELRGVTQIRGAGDTFPAVQALRQLAADVRSILGPGVKISYAADWSEYASYNDGQGNLYFHLDPLWADANIDFVGIDNYFPLSDWRDSDDHADAAWGSIYDIDYLQSNIEGGEYFDWFYGSPEEREAQRRTPITDGAHDETWVWRQKDIRGWWSHAHHERLNGVRQGGATSWIPASKPVRFTEFGCAAIDRGTNEPNKFLDKKSSESVLPHHSNGRRDDLIQMQYLRAVTSYWADATKNPVSAVYGGRMIDVGHSCVWAWDARPYPQFPLNAYLWSDGANYGKGHWLTGRSMNQPLSSVVGEICAASGLQNFDTSALYGIVRGYGVADNGTARAALQPLMLAYGFDAFDRGGKLVFRMRGGRADRSITPDMLAVGDQNGGKVETERGANLETAGRVRLTFIEAEAEYETRAMEAVFPGDDAVSVAQTELALALTRAEARRIAERWLIEARIARDGVKLTLPPSLGHVGAGDVLRIGDAPNGFYRVDRVEHAGAIAIEGTRVEEAAFDPSDEAETRIIPRAFVPPIPVYSVFLDLPLMTGEEVPHQPHLAVSARPWPGGVAVFGSDQDAGYALKQIISSRATVGETLSTLDHAVTGIWDRGPALRVRMTGEVLVSAAVEQVLNGANVMAIGDGTPKNWELMQFARAELVAPETYDISLRLRGQAGTDATMPSSWPAGSVVVLMNGAPKQISLAMAERELVRHYRIGPARRGYSDPSYSHVATAFSGIGLRPLSVSHLAVRRQANGDLDLNWIRRTRIDGDNWAAYEVPLGEGRELYLLRVRAGQAILRSEILALPHWAYPATLRQSDGLGGASFIIEVAQISDAFGAGPFARITVNG